MVLSLNKNFISSFFNLSFLCTFYSSNHCIQIRTNANYLAGQRIYTFGKLNSITKTNDQGKKISATVVKALQLYVLDKENGSTASTGGDKNSVEILANIASEISSGENDTSFAIATHFLKK